MNCILPAMILGVDPGVIMSLVPIGGLLMTLGIVVAICISVAWVKVRHRETERDILIRRMAHDERMKELEVERLRLAGAALPPAPAESDR